MQVSVRKANANERSASRFKTMVSPVRYGRNLNRLKLPRLRAPPMEEGKVDRSGEGLTKRSGKLNGFEYEAR